MQSILPVSIPPYSEEAKKSLGAILSHFPVDHRDVQDIAMALGEIITRSGYGSVEIKILGGKVDEIIISHRSKPKIGRLTEIL